MGVYDVGVAQRGRQARRERVGGVTPAVREGAQHPDAQSGRLEEDTWLATEGHELALDDRRERAG